MSGNIPYPPAEKSTISFTTMIKQYSKIQANLLAQTQYLAQNMSTANPGAFLLIQFQMSQLTQVGESISNMVSQVNSYIMAAVRNQKVQ
ncbi:MAG: hypothetical protein KGI80_02655 [Verrucomicrobiota bacterium]|nr:hypothetical protein [Verrucomicrobiota bacterium]